MSGGKAGLLRVAVLFGMLATAAGLPGTSAPLAGQQATDGQAEAAAMYQAGDWTGAIEAYEHVVAEAPDDGLAWLRLGRALIEVGREGDALVALDEVPGTGFQTPFLHLFRARALVRTGRTDDALSALEQIVPSPALGGADAIRSMPDFEPLLGSERFEAVLSEIEAAAWPCRDDETSRQFDFWVGTWDVTANGQQAGVNRVERMLGGCALQENWTNVGGREGKSFNWVDRQTFGEPRWRQLWIADQGNTLDYYDGRYEDGAMRFQGHTFDAQGDSIPQRLIFLDQAPDTVIQIFEQSNDGGETWVETWRGVYVRRAGGG